VYGPSGTAIVERGCCSCKEAVEHRHKLYGNNHPRYATSLFVGRLLTK
jgi:hypothetical protein